MSAKPRFKVGDKVYFQGLNGIEKGLWFGPIGEIALFKI